MSNLAENLKKSVAIVGGGVSGLVAANRLKQLGFCNVTVFDTGKHDAGGRCSSREVRINGQNFIFDHSCQYFTVSDPQFAKIVSFLHQNDAVYLWEGPVGHIDKFGKFLRNPNNIQCFVGHDGLQSISKCLSKQVNVQRPVWISKVKWIAESKKWDIDRHGFYDYLVIAHNGKCADKLMSNSGAPEVHSLLQVRFSDRINHRENKMTLCSLWVLLVAFPKSLLLHFEGAHIDNDPDISWISNNTAKLKGKTNLANGVRSLKTGDIPECWTIFSTRAFGKIHKVPQEMVPPSKAIEVTKMLLDAFARVTKLERKSLDPLFTKVQLWGAAVPLNTLADSSRCIFDVSRQVGVCGDWLVSPCIEGAALSGLALAERIQRHANGDKEAGTDLRPRFRPVHGPPIGCFPSNPKLLFHPQGKT